jgi:hypothetical protein
MSPVWLAFLCGGFLGFFTGMTVIALCFAAKRGDDDMPVQRHCDYSQQGRECRTCQGRQS